MKDARNTHEINKKKYEYKSKGFLFLFVSENNSHLHLSKRMENSSFKISVIFPSFHVSPTHSQRCRPYKKIYSCTVRTMGTFHSFNRARRRRRFPRTTRTMRRRRTKRTRPSPTSTLTRTPRRYPEEEEEALRLPALRGGARPSSTASWAATDRGGRSAGSDTCCRRRRECHAGNKRVFLYHGSCAARRSSKDFLIEGLKLKC